MEDVKIEALVKDLRATMNHLNHLRCELDKQLKAGELKMEVQDADVIVNGIEGRFIDGYDDYFLTRDGEVYSFKNNKVRKLRPSSAGDGYSRVALCKNGKPKSRPIYRLLAETYLHKPLDPECNVVRHLNDIKTDNRLENLAWGSNRDNKADAIRNGRIPMGSSLPQSKLKEDEVREIIELFKDGVRSHEIAKIFNISEQTICDIKKCRIWKQIDR